MSHFLSNTPHPHQLPYCKGKCLEIRQVLKEGGCILEDELKWTLDTKTNEVLLDGQKSNFSVDENKYLDRTQWTCYIWNDERHKMVYPTSTYSTNSLRLILTFNEI